MKKNKIDAIDLAKFFIIKNSITSAFRLQKLVYFTFREYLIEKDGKEKLFNETFEAWVNGPVIRSIYDFFKEAEGNTEIGYYISKEKENKELNWNNEIYEFAQKVFDKLNDKQTNYLVAKSHDSAWIKARKNLPSYQSSNNPILIEDIFKTKDEYYINKF